MNIHREIFDSAEMIVNFKKPEECKWQYLREGQLLYIYLHLAVNKPLVDKLLKKKIKVIAFKIITYNARNLSCLRPMSQMDGRLSIQKRAKYLEKQFGGRGILLGGVLGAQRSCIVIINGSVAETYAAKASVGIDARVILLHVNPNRLTYFGDIFGVSVKTLYSTEANTRKVLAQANLVIDSFLIPDGKKPKFDRREHLKLMKLGANIIDIATDQGGCCESSYITVHYDPISIEEGIVHYCVGNM